MAEARSLCRIDWKLGQALMPEHFLKQEDSLRREWEMRFAHQPLPMWGLVDLEWDVALLEKTWRLSVQRLELVFETGLLVDVPGNARPVSIDLPKPGSDPVDIFIHLDSEPEVIKGTWSDEEGSLVELRMQKLVLAVERLKTAQPGFHLLRLMPAPKPSGPGPDRAPSGWVLDPTYTPPLVNVFALSEFGLKQLATLERELTRWKDMLRARAVENTLGVHKRVEASLYLRRAQGANWALRQISPRLDAAGAPPHAADHRQAPALQAHPFELFSRFVELYLDVFAFRCGPSQTLERAEPVGCLYEHEDLAKCFASVEVALKEELDRPGAGSREWEFVRDALDSDRLVCKFPQRLALDAEVYFLVEFEGQGVEVGPLGKGLDPRLLGVKLAAPDRLEAVQQRVLPGVPLERVRLLPFPHDFDTATTQFYRLEHGPEWGWVHAAQAIAYHPGDRPIKKSFVFCPDVRA